MKHLQGSGVLFTGAAVVLMAAQPVWAAATQVTAVQLSPTNSGFNLLLQTSKGDRPQVFTNRRGKTLVADIINTQLRLPQGNSFRQDNPAPGITSVVINQLDSNSIRMVVTGTTDAPSSQLAQRDAQGITLSISPASAAPAAPPPPGQTPTAQKPDVLVPNPEVTIDGVPAPAPGTPPAAPPAAPPTLPRAIAPPVGDIAISNVDSSPAAIDMGTAERVPRLVLRDAPVREVLALLARAAGLNLAFTTAAAAVPGQEQAAPAPGGEGGPRISLDIENESVQDVFNYVLRLSGLQANRSGRTIFVGPRLPNEARDVIVRSYRLNQVTAGVALNFLVAMGAESAVSRERTITSVQAVPVGGGTTPATQTQTTTETRVETQRIDFQDAVPLLRGLQAVGDERTNSVTLIGSSKQVDIATAQLVQLDARRRQVAVNVKIVDVNLLATEDFNTSFSFGIGDTFFSNDGGAASLNFGGFNPPGQGSVTGSVPTPPVITNPFAEAEVFFDTDVNNAIDVPGTEPGTIQVAPDGVIGLQPRGTGSFFSPFVRLDNPLNPGITDITPAEDNIITIDADGEASITQGTPGEITVGLPSLFQYPKKFLSTLQAQVVSGNAKILTDPTLIVQEGQQANVNLTQQVVGNIEIEREGVGEDSITTVTAEKENVGLTLSIRVERIDDNGFISLSVAPIVRAPQASQNLNLGQGAEQTIFLVSERSLNSGLIRLRDSQTLILSGIIQDQDRSEVSKVPILGDIPILGALFRSTRRVNQRQEVVVLLTPQIMDDSERSSSFGYNYTPSPDVRQMLERRGGLQGPPGNNQVPPGNNPVETPPR